MVPLGLALVVGATIGLGELLEGPLRATVLSGFDRPVIRWFAGRRTAALTEVMRLVTVFGGTIFAIVFLTALAIVAYVVTRSPRWLAFFAGVMAGALGLAMILKPVIGRARPDLAPVYGVSTEAFPSGHATAAAACFVALAYLALRCARSSVVARSGVFIAVVMAALVGITRIYLGVHWPTDVLAGWALGTGWVVVIATAVRPPARERPRAGGILPA